MRLLLLVLILVGGAAYADTIQVAEYKRGGSVEIRYVKGKGSYQVHICDQYIVNTILANCSGAQLGAVKSAILAANKKAYSLGAGVESDNKHLALGGASVLVNAENDGRRRTVYVFFSEGADSIGFLLDAGASAEEFAAVFGRRYGK